MTNLYPPVLDNKAYSIPYKAVVPTGILTEDYYNIIFSMPSMNSPSDIHHLQVVIKYQATNQPAVNSLLSPDKATLFIDATLGLQNNYWKKYDDYGNYQLSIPYWAFEGGKPKENTTYTVQVRFGANVLWGDAQDGLQGTGFSNFSAWRQNAVTNVPSMFGEWSNVQTVYCYSAYATNFDYNYNDFVPELIWFYQPKGDDPIEQVKVLYSYKDFDGQQYKTQVFNGQYNGDNTYTLKTQIPIAPFFMITGTVEAITQNNTLITTSFTVLPISISNNPSGESQYGAFYSVFPSGELSIKKLEGEESNDGVLAVELYSKASAPEGYTINVYRCNLLSLQTIRIAEGLDSGAGYRHVVKDFTVEMGEEYEYIACLMNTQGNLDRFWFNPIPYGTSNKGYGRLMAMEASFLTNRKHQLRLQGDVKVSAYKRNTNDLFQTTIGSQFPFYSRNAMNNYRTLNVSAIISINFDPTSAFLRLDRDNGLFWDEQETVSSDSVYNSQIKEYSDAANQMQKALNTMMVEWQEYEEGIDWNRYKAEENYKMDVDKQLNEYRTRQTYYQENLFDLRAKITRGKSQLQIVDTDLFSETQWSLSRRRAYPEDHSEQGELVQLGKEDPKKIAGQRTIFSPYLNKQMNPMYGTDLSDRMVFIERKFRDLVMSWLSDGTPKLFRSETEGNMIVAVTGVSFSPFNSTRMIYSMSCTLTEIAEYNLENLVNYNLIPSAIETNYEFVNDYEFFPGDKDPWVDVSLIYQYRPTFDIPDTQVGTEITPIDTYSAVLNGAPPYTFKSISLPDGLKIDSEKGIISGKPTYEKQNITTAKIQVKDAGGDIAIMEISVGVFYPALVFDPITKSIEVNAVGIQIEPFDVTSLVRGGVPPYQFFAQNLPVGIYIDRVKGVVQGAYAQETEPGTAIIIVIDSKQNQASQKLTYGKGVLPLTFNYMDSFNIPMSEVSFPIKEIDVSIGVYGGIYDTEKSASGYLFSMTGAPEGITIDRETGVISGTPTMQQNSGTITITVADFAENLPDMTPNTATITITFEKVLPRMVFTDFGNVFDIVRNPDGSMAKLNLGHTIEDINLMDPDSPAVVGGLPYQNGSPYIFSSIDLWPNFEVTSDGIIRGTTTHGGIEEHEATIIATDQRGRYEQIKVLVSEVTTKLTVIKDPTNYKLPEIVLNETPEDYGFKIPFDAVSGGTAPYSATISNFPPGVTLTEQEIDGKSYYVISGSPTAISGEKMATITFSDSSTITQTYDLQIPVGGVYAKLVWNPIRSLDIPERTVGTEFRGFGFDGISGGKAPYNFGSENLTQYGLKVVNFQDNPSPSTAYIAGTSTTPQPEGIGIITLTDALGQKATVTFKIGKVYTALSLEIANHISHYTFISGVTEIPESKALKILQAKGGTPPYTYSLVNATTFGGGFQLMTKDNGDGTQGGYIIGQPTSKIDSQDLSYLFKVTDAENRQAFLPAGVSWYCAKVCDPPYVYPQFAAQQPYPGGTLTYNRPIAEIGPIFNMNGYSSYNSWGENLPNGIKINSYFIITGSPIDVEPEAKESTVYAATNPNDYTPSVEISCKIKFDGVVTKLNYTKVPTDLMVPALGLNKEMTPIIVSGGRSGGLKPYQWSAVGLPPGLQLTYSGDGLTCSITGTPTETSEGGEITIKVVDSLGDTGQIVISYAGVYPPLVFTDSPAYDIPPKNSGETIDDIDVSGGVSGGSGKITFSSPDLGNYGYYITDAGVIQGAALELGKNAGEATITATDEKGQTASITIAVGEITGPLNFSPTPEMNIPAGKVNTAIDPIDLRPAVSGGSKIYTFSFVAETMPTNWNGKITLDPSTGVITGTRPASPTDVSEIQIQVKDTEGAVIIREITADVVNN